MTEHGTATLAVQGASVWVAGIAGAAQCGVGGRGLFVIRRDFHRRDARRREHTKGCKTDKKRKTNDIGKTNMEENDA